MTAPLFNPRDFLHRLFDVAVAAAMVLFAASAPCFAQVVTSSEDDRLLYDFMFGGLRVGNVLVTFHEGAGAYRSEMNAQAKGLLKAAIGGFRADLTGSGQVVETQPVRLQPDQFRRAWAVGRWGSVMIVTFDPLTHIASSHERLFNPDTGEDLADTDLPWGHHKRLPHAPSIIRVDALDPMTAFIAGRDLIRQNWQSNAPTAAETRLSIFDGRHRYDVVLKQGAVKEEDIHGTINRVVPVTIRTEPTGGFEADMAKHTREGEGTVMFSADARFLPLQVIVGNSLGTGVFNLTADCTANPAPCDAFAEQSKISDKAQPQSAH